MTRRRRRALRGRIGFLTEAPGLWDRLTVRQNLLVYARLHGLPRPDRAVDMALGSVRHRRPRADDRRRVLSKGLRQRVALARTLLHEPRDRAARRADSGLDPGERPRRPRARAAAARRAARGALSTHNLDEVERLADRVAVLRTRWSPSTRRRRCAPALRRARPRSRSSADAGRLRAAAARRPAPRDVARRRPHALDRPAMRRAAGDAHSGTSSERLVEAGRRCRGRRARGSRRSKRSTCGCWKTERAVNMSRVLRAARQGTARPARGSPGIFVPAMLTGRSRSAAVLRRGDRSRTSPASGCPTRADFQVALEMYRDQPGRARSIRKAPSRRGSSSSF